MTREDADVPDWPDHTAVPTSELLIRLPVAFRIYIVIFAVIWCGGVLAGLIAALAKFSPAAMIPAAMLVFGGFFMWHVARLAVIGDHEGLTVRGYYRSRRIPKFEVEGFRIGSGYYPFGNCTFALVRDQESYRPGCDSSGWSVADDEAKTGGSVKPAPSMVERALRPIPGCPKTRTHFRRGRLRRLAMMTYPAHAGGIQIRAVIAADRIEPAQSPQRKDCRNEHHGRDEVPS